jgi:SAM-dependent methyltransferase
VDQQKDLPDDFLRIITDLEASYLQSDDPMRQSGFGGGAKRWRAEREPILEAVDGDGDFLDIGCANGYLLGCLVEWGQERGYTLTPHGLDIGPGLIALAKERLPHFADNFYIDNAWDWTPPQRFRYVYVLTDFVPLEYLAEFTARLVARIVARGGRLIVGNYGSFSRQIPPLDVEAVLRSMGYEVVGAAAGGNPVMARFVWIDAPLL